VIRTLLLFFVVLSTSVARADVIPEDFVPPSCAPLSCPAGSMAGGAGHGCPSACVPWNQTCTTSAECGGPGWACTPTRFCLDRRPAGRVITDVVLGVCADDGSCTEGTCSEVSRCMPDPTYVPPPGSTPPAASTGSSASSAPAESSSMCAIGHGRAGAWLVIVGLAFFFRRR
jgi:hypothetical protein